MTTVRPIRPGEDAAARTVVRTVYDEYGFTWDEGDYHSDLYNIDAEYDGFWVAVEHDDTPQATIVGVIGLTVFDPLPGEVGTTWHDGEMIRAAGSDCEFCRLYVLPSARGNGTGRRLSDACLSAAREQGCQAMEIWSDKRFAEAHNLYRSLGAVQIGERICNDPDEAPEWGFVLQL